MSERMFPESVVKAITGQMTSNQASSAAIRILSEGLDDAILPDLLEKFATYNDFLNFAGALGRLEGLAAKVGAFREFVEGRTALIDGLRQNFNGSWGVDGIIHRGLQESERYGNTENAVEFAAWGEARKASMAIMRHRITESLRHRGGGIACTK